MCTTSLIYGYMYNTYTGSTNEEEITLQAAMVVNNSAIQAEALLESVTLNIHYYI